MKDVIPLLSTLPLREELPGEGSIYPRPILYAAENDHKVGGEGGAFCWRVGGGKRVDGTGWDGSVGRWLLASSPIIPTLPFS